MAILCGVDIVEIDRIKKSIDTLGDSFKNRVFTQNEIAYCESKKATRFQSYAARFAAKEAVSKAFGTGICESLSWKDIEVSNDPKGRPYIIYSDKINAMLSSLGGGSISLSLSHSDSYAVAYVVIETKSSNCN